MPECDDPPQYGFVRLYEYELPSQMEDSDSPNILKNLHNEHAELAVGPDDLRARHQHNHFFGAIPRDLSDKIRPIIGHPFRAGKTPAAVT